MYLNQDQADCHLREVVQQRLRLKDAVLPSIQPHTGHRYTIKEGMAGLVEEEGPGDYQMQCFPLYSLILATGI